MPLQQPSAHGEPSLLKSPLSLTRRAFFLYLAFVIYGSLVPLRFTPIPLADALAAFGNIPFLNLGIGSRADWVSNLVLFVPLTFLACEACPRQRRLVWLITAVGITVGAIALSFAIEFTQLFFPPRTVSQNDILAESLGGLLGVMLSGFLGARFQTWLANAWASETRKEKATRLLQAYLLILVSFNVLPLDLTISPVEIFHKWREGKIIFVPFTGFKGSVSEFIYEKLTDMAVWIPAGMLWARSGRASLGQMAARGLAAALVVELLQLFVYSRVSDVTDVILGGAGCFLGAWVMTLWGSGMNVFLAPRHRNRWLAGWFLWLLAALFIFWFPFDFTADHASREAAVVAFTRTPFTTYYFSSEFHAINELLRKIGFFFPGGLLLGFALHCRSGGARTGLLPWASLFLALGAGVEIGQLFLPGKIPDITDVFLEAGGGVLGIVVARWLTREGSTAAIPVLPKAVNQAPRKKPGKMPEYLYHLAILVTLSVLIQGLSRLPGIPYNVRDLIESFGSALGLASVIYLVGNSCFLQIGQRKGRLFVLFPVFLALQGIVVWILLRLSVPMESIHDIVGSPVLNWPWEWELLLRFVALHQVVSLQVFGATLFVAAICRPINFVDWVYWLLASVLLAWPLHVFVVDWAATDNLTELMRDGGGIVWSTCLASGIFMTCVAGTALGAAIHFPEKRKHLAIALLVALPVAVVVLDWGTEPALFKYGQVFSAAQFLLSPDRTHYLQGAALLPRLLLLFALITIGFAAIQFRSWKWFRNSALPDPGPGRRR